MRLHSLTPSVLQCIKQWITLPYLSRQLLRFLLTNNALISFILIDIPGPNSPDKRRKKKEYLSNTKPLLKRDNWWKPAGLSRNHHWTCPNKPRQYFPPESTPGRLSPSDPWMVLPAFRPPWRLRLPNYPSCKCLFFETLRPVWRPKLTKVRCNSTYVAGGLVNGQLRKLVHFERSSRDEFSSRVAKFLLSRDRTFFDPHKGSKAD